MMKKKLTIFHSPFAQLTRLHSDLDDKPEEEEEEEEESEEEEEEEPE